MVVAHENGAGGVLAVVGVRQVRVAVHVGIAVARDVKVSTGTENRPATGRKFKFWVESDQSIFSFFQDA